MQCFARIIWQILHLFARENDEMYRTNRWKTVLVILFPSFGTQQPNSGFSLCYHVVCRALDKHQSLSLVPTFSRTWKMNGFRIFEIEMEIKNIFVQCSIKFRYRMTFVSRINQVRPNLSFGILIFCLFHRLNSSVFGNFNVKLQIFILNTEYVNIFRTKRKQN